MNGIFIKQSDIDMFTFEVDMLNRNSLEAVKGSEIFSRVIKLIEKGEVCDLEELEDEISDLDLKNDELLEENVISTREIEKLKEEIKKLKK